MSARPIVRRTYGKRAPTTPVQSSSSCPSSPIATPPTLSSSPGRDLVLAGSSPPTSPSPDRKRIRLSKAEPVVAISHADLTRPRGRIQQSQSQSQSVRPLGRIDTNCSTQSTLKSFFAPVPKKRTAPAPAPPSGVEINAFPATRSDLGPSDSDSIHGGSSSILRSDSGPSSPPSSSSPRVSLLPQPAGSGPTKSPIKSTGRRPYLTQLVFSAGILKTCHECGMSFMRGTDDTMHGKHHARVTRGILWDGLGRRIRSSTGKEKGHSHSNSVSSNIEEAGWTVIQDRIPLTTSKGSTYKIIMVDGSWSTPRLDEIYTTVDTVLAAPPLPDCIRQRCKLFLAVTSAQPPRGKLLPSKYDKEKGERVVGIVVAQPIKTAMRVLGSGSASASDASVGVDSGGGVMCDPTPLPTPLGIHRLFTVPAFRSHGLGYALLDAATRHTVYGCAFDPKAGQVAFSQPTHSGRAVMEKWGNGGVRVFIDDESQV